MSRKSQRVCRECRSFVDGDKCPVCGSEDLGHTWAGIAVIIDPEKSEVAKKMDVDIPGKFALKVR